VLFRRVVGVDRWTVASAVAVVALLFAATATAAGTAAAGETTVGLAPGADSVDVGENATVRVVVDDADGGVGAAAVEVTTDDSSVARIVDVELAGDPQFTDVSIADDGSSATVAVVGADTADSGSVPILSVTVAGEADGTTDFSLNVSALGARRRGRDELRRHRNDRRDPDGRRGDGRGPDRNWDRPRRADRRRVGADGDLRGGPERLGLTGAVGERHRDDLRRSVTSRRGDDLLWPGFRCRRRARRPRRARRRGARASEPGKWSNRRRGAPDSHTVRERSPPAAAPGPTLRFRSG
jgi:hypothetical protein